MTATTTTVSIMPLVILLSIIVVAVVAATVVSSDSSTSMPLVYASTLPTQTIVTLQDDAAGNTAGWNPGPAGSNIQIIGYYRIVAPITLGNAFTIEATYTSPTIDPGVGGRITGNCHLMNPGVQDPNVFYLACGHSLKDGTSLTYVISQN